MSDAVELSQHDSTVVRSNLTTTELFCPRKRHFVMFSSVLLIATSHTSISIEQFKRNAKT